MGMEHSGSPQAQDPPGVPAPLLWSWMAPPSLAPWNQPQLSPGMTQLHSCSDISALGIPQPNRIQHTERPGPAQLSITATPHIKPRCLCTRDGLQMIHSGPKAPRLHSLITNDDPSQPRCLPVRYFYLPISDSSALKKS